MTGIAGFDDITLGGLPAGRPSLICGGVGSGKTLFALTFLVNGATQFDEPGVFVSFEERAEDLVANYASLGQDLNRLIAGGTLAIDDVRIDRREIAEAGEYDLEGLFIRLGFAVDSIGAKRIVLDTIETLFSGFANNAIIRAELRRLFGWIKDRGLTAIITGERGDGQLTRHGLEEYVADCVIVLDNRVEDQIATRRFRIVKYRGSSHGTNEYPFLIDAGGISVLPLTSSGINRTVSNEIVSTGVPGLDAMLRNGGFFRGSSVLLSGAAGTGKTTFASHFIDAACERGERCMFFPFEENADEICRNIRSVGIDLKRWIDCGLLQFEAARPSTYGLEMHLARMVRDLDRFQPQIVVLDPISAFQGSRTDVHSVLLRMVDLLKSRGITALFTSLRTASSALERMDQGLSSLMDSWIELINVKENGERNRTLSIMKSRGTSHSNQIREYLITDGRIELLNAYIGTSGVLTGTARTIQEAEDQAADRRRRDHIDRGRRNHQRRCAALERQIAELRATLDSEEEQARVLFDEEQASEAALGHERSVVAARRGARE